MWQAPEKRLFLLATFQGLGVRAEEPAVSPGGWPALNLLRKNAMSNYPPGFGVQERRAYFGPWCRCSYGQHCEQCESERDLAVRAHNASRKEKERDARVIEWREKCAAKLRAKRAKRN